MVLVNIKTIIVIDIVSFWRWLMFSNCVFESMWAPRNQFATDIPYLKAMARLLVSVSQNVLRIISECTVKEREITDCKKEKKRDF
tara:strand:- start:330 stop:584 length:255 start_codon:yes stop_codon:yes gene_type:complete